MNNNNIIINLQRINRLTEPFYSFETLTRLNEKWGKYAELPYDQHLFSSDIWISIVIQRMILEDQISIISGQVTKIEFLLFIKHVCLNPLFFQKTTQDIIFTICNNFVSYQPYYKRKEVLEILQCINNFFTKMHPPEWRFNIEYSWILSSPKDEYIFND